MHHIRKIAEVADFQRDKLPHEIISDIKNGVNFERIGFKALADCNVSEDIEQLVFIHKNRTCCVNSDIHSLNRCARSLVAQSSCNLKATTLIQKTLPMNCFRSLLPPLPKATDNAPQNKRRVQAKETEDH